MTSNHDIRIWYNRFSKDQETLGTNLRHYTIMNYMLRSGLKRHHKVLEVGAGIGIITSMLQKYLKTGTVVATDISDESIGSARKRVKQATNVELLVTDMQDFQYPEKFDFILLPDVLEHIPLEKHHHLFGALRAHMKESSVIIIHIPHPKATDYYRACHPEKLQIIDQSLEADKLLQDACENDLILVDYLSYPLYHKENDYVFIRFRIKNEVVLTPLKKPAIIRKKFIRRLRYFFHSSV